MLNLVGYASRGADFVSEQRRRFGPIFRTCLASHPQVWVCDPEAAIRIARNQDGAWSTALGWTSIFAGIYGDDSPVDSLGTLDFDLHKEARRLMQPAFEAQAMGSYLAAAQPVLDRAVDGWLESGRIAFKPEVRRLLANVSSRIFLGDVERGAFLDRTLAQAWSGVFAITKNEWISPTWLRARRAAGTLHDTLMSMVPERRARGGADLFSRLCSEPIEAGWIDDATMVRLFIGVMLGAFDSTSAGVASMAYLLARHPEWQEALRDELRSTGEGPLTIDVARQLDATDRAWRETLRLFPVASAVPRCTLREVDLGGHRLPAGTMAIAMFGAVQRDGEWWTDPLRFDPDRFSDARAEDRRRPGLFMPFGAGPHACIGTQLATLEVKALWRAMLTRCRFRLARTDERVRHILTPIGTVSGNVELVVERV
jgi:cytochrome P450